MEEEALTGEAKGLDLGFLFFEVSSMVFVVIGFTLRVGFFWVCGVWVSSSSEEISSSFSDDAEEEEEEEEEEADRCSMGFFERFRAMDLKKEGGIVYYER